MRRGTLGYAAAAAALAVAGCGGGGSDTLSKAELAKKANAICAKYAKEGDQLKPPSDIGDPKQAAAFFDKAKDIARRQQQELEGLKPADAVKQDYEAMTAATGDATRLLSDLTDAAKAKDAAKGRQLLQKLQPASDQVDKTANAIGASKCAS